jgi:hypothetical protein
LCPGKYFSFVKVKIKVKFTIAQATKAQRGSRGMAIFYFNLGARWRWVFLLCIKTFVGL